MSATDSVLSKRITIEGVTVHLYDPSVVFPKACEDDPEFSVDVCIIDEENMHGLAYYIFAERRWSFHTDTLVDYNEIGAETKWMWYYPVVNANDIFKIVK